MEEHGKNAFSNIFRPPDSYVSKSLDEKKDIMAKNFLDALSASDDSYKYGAKEYLTKLFKYLGIPEGDFNVDTEHPGKLGQIRNVVDVLVSTIEQKIADGESMENIIQAGFTVDPLGEILPLEDPNYLKPKKRKKWEKKMRKN